MLFTLLIAGPVVVIPLFFKANPDMSYVVRQVFPLVPVGFMSCVIVSVIISPKTSFVIGFIDEAVKCGPHARYILQFMPSNMVIIS